MDMTGPTVILQRGQPPLGDRVMKAAERATSKLTGMRFPPDLLADLKAVSAVTGVSVTDLVVNALRPALAKLVKNRKIGPLVEKVKRERGKK